MKKTILSVPLALFPMVAFAQERIVSGLQQMLTWSGGLVAVCGGLGITYAAVRMQTGDEEAPKKMRGTLIGSIIGLSAGGLMVMLSRWFLS